MKKEQDSKKNVIVLGAGGHAKVIADIIQQSQDNLIGFLDDNIELQNKKIFLDKKVIGKIGDIEKYKDFYFVIGIGNNEIRKKISKENQLNYYTAIHPSAIISSESSLGEGTVVMPGAVINPGTQIGKHCIINSGAIIEHDNIIKDYVHISPNATLCGTVKVEENTHIGAGAVIKNNINITKNCTIGAGAVVVKNIDTEGTYVGVPAKRIKE